MLDSNWLNPEHRKPHSIDPRQFMDFRQSTLPNGTRIVEAYNSSGLHFTLLPDRGLDVWSAHYNGIPLTWISQGSPHPPDFGLSWLEQFNGGLLTTCGLTHVGPPETDRSSGEVRDLHGKFSRLRAEGLRVEWGEDARTLALRGSVAESSLFGTQLRLERRYVMILGEPGFMIEDHITNLGDSAAPLMFLYHVNLGYPLIAQGTRLATAYVGVYPRDEVARMGLDTWPEYIAAKPDYAEQVFYHHLKCDEQGATEAVIYREQFGLSLRWSSREMPYLNQWKNTRQGIYVCGVEPANCIPEGQNSARAKERLVMLAPGASQRFGLRVTVLGSGNAVAHSINRIYKLREAGVPVANCKLDDYRLS